MNTNTETKKVTVNFNQAKTGIELRFNFVPTKEQTNYIKTKLGYHWWNAKKYWWRNWTEESMKEIYSFLEVLESRGYEVDVKSYKRSLSKAK